MSSNSSPRSSLFTSPETSVSLLEHKPASMTSELPGKQANASISSNVNSSTSFSYAPFTSGAVSPKSNASSSLFSEPRSSIDPSSEQELAVQLSNEDPLATQMWKFFVRAKNAQHSQVPHATRMENLSWRMGGMKLEQIRSKQHVRAQSEETPSSSHSLFSNAERPVNSTSGDFHQDLYSTSPEHSPAEARGRVRKPAAFGGSTASPRDTTVKGNRSQSKSRHGGSDGMDWRASSRSRSRSRPPLSRIPEPTPPTAALNLDQLVNPAFATDPISDFDPDSIAASLGLGRSPPFNDQPPHQQNDSGQEGQSNAHEEDLLSSCYQVNSNEVLYSSNDDHYQQIAASERLDDSDIEWSSSCPQPSILTEHFHRSSDCPDDDEEFAHKLKLFTNDEPARARGHTNSIPGLINERGLKQNQHSEYGFVPRLVRKTSFDERQGSERANDQHRVGRRHETSPFNSSVDFRRPSPARAVVVPGKKRNFDRTMSPLRFGAIDPPPNGQPRAFAGRVEAAGKRSSQNVDEVSSQVSGSWNLGQNLQRENPNYAPGITNGTGERNQEQLQMFNFTANNDAASGSRHVRSSFPQQPARRWDNFRDFPISAPASGTATPFEGDALSFLGNSTSNTNSGDISVIDSLFSVDASHGIHNSRFPFTNSSSFADTGEVSASVSAPGLQRDTDLSSGATETMTRQHENNIQPRDESGVPLGQEQSTGPSWTRQYPSNSRFVHSSQPNATASQMPVTTGTLNTTHFPQTSAGNAVSRIPFTQYPTSDYVDARGQPVQFHHPFMSTMTGNFVSAPKMASPAGGSPSSGGDSTGSISNTPGVSASNQAKKLEISICSNCQISNTTLWRRDESGNCLCNSCGLYLKLHGVARPLSLATGVIKKRNRGRGKTDETKPSAP